MNDRQAHAVVKGAADGSIAVAGRPLVVLYATREGQTRRIGERVGARLRALGFAVDVVDVGQAPPGFDLRSYCAAVVAASVHVGKHEPEMVAFVKAHRAELERVPAAFLSVSLAAASAETADTSVKRAEAAGNVRAAIDAFLRETAWRPGRVHPIAGALLYRKYGLLVRWVMRYMAKRGGLTTDTSRDYEFTDWQALDGLAEEIAASAAPDHFSSASRTQP